MSPASSGTTSIGGNHSRIDEDNRDGKRREDETDSSSLFPLLPLPPTSTPSSDLLAASALSSALLPLFPPVSAAWAYGSGVLSQQQTSGGSKPTRPRPPRPSVDLLLAVGDPRGWHERNLELNPGHYSPLARGLLGPRGVSWAGENVAPGVWFNSGVRVRTKAAGAGAAAVGGKRKGEEEGEEEEEEIGVSIKYGVFSERALLTDLETWNELYLAGRLQKPTLRLLSTKEEGAAGSSFAPELDKALEGNAAAALAAALLLLPATFSHSRLLSTLVSLSYSGDVRVAAAAEDPLKVEKIVSGTGRERLDGLYSRHLFSPLSSASSSASSSSSSFASSSSSSSSSSSVASAAGLVLLCDGNAWAQDPRRDSRRELVELLPERVRRKVKEEKSSSFASSSPNSFYFSSSSTPLFSSSVRAALASTVRSSSARAALVGLVSAGPAKAASYALAKLRKGGWGGAKT